MTWREKINKYLFFPVIAVFRYIYSSGQSAFPYAKFGQYAFKTDNHPATLALIGTAIVANVGTNSIVKIPAMYRDLVHHPAEHPIEPVFLRTSGKCVSGLFKVAGAGLIFLEFISGDFGVIYLLDQLGGLVGFDFHSTTGREIFSQVIGALGGGASAKIFHSYEYAVVGKKNADRLAQLFEEGNYLQKISQNKAPLAKTMTVMTMAALTYVTLSAFWTKAATDDFADKNGILDDTSKYIMCTFSSFFTLIFTLGWTPTAFDMFTRHTQTDAAPHRAYQHSCKAQFASAIAKFCIPQDMMTWAVTTFMAVISNAEEFLGMDPYGSSIGLGVACALTAGGFYGLSLLPGAKKTLNEIAANAADDGRLLPADSKFEESKEDIAEPDSPMAERDAFSARALITSPVSLLNSLRVEEVDESVASEKEYSTLSRQI